MSESESVLLSLQAAILRNDLQTIDALMAHLDRLSANEALRQLGEEWGFATGEVVGSEVRVMLMRDLAKLTYGYEDTTPLRSLLRRYGRKPLEIKVSDHESRKQIRKIFGSGYEGRRLPTLATWVDVLIIGMRGQTEAAKKLQGYLLNAERENRIRWTLERISEHMERTTLPLHMLTQKVVQIDRAKAHNSTIQAIIQNGGPRSLWWHSWQSLHQDHTGRDGKYWQKKAEDRV